MLRVIELIREGDLYVEKATFINRTAIISVTEDALVSRAITEQRGSQAVVSRISLNLPEGSRTVFALGTPDSIMDNSATSRRGILHG